MRKVFLFKVAAVAAVLFLFHPLVNAQEGMMKITSPAFDHNTMIPKKYTCQGKDVSPPLAISGIPEGTVSLALINDDPDAPMGTWDHWVIWNIKPVEEILENTAPGIQGRNSGGTNDYGGPCPPSGTHRYFFKLYALDSTLELKEGATKAKLETAMKGHILAQAELIGLYKKS
jgi:Raf kinase inhibitor-like YbhB/YbcL family protein